MTLKNNSIKLFISYSHDDEPYFKVFNEGLKKVAKNPEGFEWSIWDDTQIHIGSFWDNEIQNNILDCNVALLLISVGFMSSKYIREKEYAEFARRYEERNILIVPVVFAPCDFERWEDLSRLQFFKPSGASYGQAQIANFTYADLIHFRSTDGILIPNPNINRYHLDLFKKIEISYKDFLSRVSPPTKSELQNSLGIKKLSDAPKPKAYFTGRDSELEEFRIAIEQGITLITIDGPGGIGKTQFTSMCIERYIPADKIIWYDCTSVSQLDTLISESGYPELLIGSNKSDRDKFSAFKDKIQDNGLYLFLDNFQETNNNPVFKKFLEFIQDYLKAGCVIVLDRDDIRSAILTPKRIHIEGFKEKRLEYAMALIEFAYKGEVKISDEKLDDLCGKLQGYPLAIDFAIYLLSQGETPDDILTKIVNETEVYQISERLLNAIFDRSDATLEEKDFMRQFSVFTGNVSDDAIHSVISEKIYKSATRPLQKKNLLAYVNNQYSIHPLVREFCYKELNDKISVHAKVAEHYIQQRTELNPALEELIFYHLDKSEQWERIETEITQNGRRFIMLGQLGLVTELLNKLKRIGLEKPIFNIFYGDIAEVHGNWENAKRYYEYAADQDEDKKVKAEGIIKVGEMLYRRGNVKEALPYFEHANSFCKENNFKKEEARAINDIGLVFDVFGDYPRALQEYNEALLIRKKDDPEGHANTLLNIGAVLNHLGKIQKALETNYEALQEHTSIGNKNGIAIALGNIGVIFLTQKKYLESELKFNECLQISTEIGNKHIIAYCLRSLGLIHMNNSRLSEASNYFEKAIQIQLEIGDKDGLAQSLHSRGSLFALKNDYIKAMNDFEESLQIAEEIGKKNLMSSVFNNISNLLVLQHKYAEALKYQNKSIVINTKIGALRNLHVDFHNIGTIYTIDKFVDYRKALFYLFQAWGLYQKLSLDEKTTILSQIKSIRENNKLGRDKFRILARQVYNEIDNDLKPFVPIEDISNPGYKFKKAIGQNDSCPCGSGKQYKRCHGKNT